MLKGKTAVITGASRGIGACIAEKFASLGANVAIVDYGNLDMADKLKRKLEKDVKAEVYRCDVSSSAECKETIDKIIASGCKAALAVKPGTDIEAVYPYLDRLSMVLVMTVEPGFGGQSYIEAMNEKIALLRRAIDNLEKDIDLEVDGGINAENFSSYLSCKNVGAVGGSWMCPENLIKEKKWQEIEKLCEKSNFPRIKNC